MTERTLDELKIFQYEPRYRNLLGESLLKKMDNWGNTIRIRKEEPFTLVVCGEFKRGKSSFINALLREEVVTTNVTTETVTLNKICYGAHANEAILSAGRRMLLTDEELQKSRLEELISQSKEPITQLELHRPIELLKYVTIIDTPGLNDSLKNFESLVEHALQQADAVVYICSVDSPFSQNEQLFLRTMILPQKYTDLFIVANYADMLRKRDYDRFQEFMNDRISALISGKEVILLSALDELCRIEEEERPNEELSDKLASNFDEFRDTLTHVVQMKKDVLLPDRIHRLTYGMEADISGELDAMEAGLELDTKQAVEQMEVFQKYSQEKALEQEHIQKKMKTRFLEMQVQANDWMEELLNKMKLEVDMLHDISSEEIIKYYSIYCIDTIQEAINRCVEYHMKEIYDELDAISFEAVKGISVPMKDNSYGFRFALDNKTWTMGDNVSYVASKISQLGLLSLVVDGVAGAMRQKETGNRKDDILRAIKEQYPGFIQSAQSTIRDTYGKLAEMVQLQLMEYFKGEMEQEKVQNEQMMRVARQTKENKEEIREAILQLRNALKSLTTIF